MKKVLLTGASGYIGKHVALQLLKNGYEVRASVRSLRKADEVRAAVLPRLPEDSEAESRLTFVELDLEQDTGWDTAVTGIDVLVHTASPFPIAAPKHENDLIVPAVEGTLRALRAAHAAGVQRVVLTSSVAAVYGTNLPDGKTSYDESVFTDVNHPVGRQAYTKSKALAEAAAWNYVRNDAPEITLTTVNPVLVLGAPLDKNFGSSVSIVQRLLSGRDPMLPDLAFSLVHVEDVAQMHVQAIDNERTFGERIIGSAGAMTFVEMARCLQAEYPSLKIVKPQAPNAIMKFLALFDAEIKSVLPMLGDRTPVDASKAERLLGMQFRSVGDTVIETARFVRGLS